MSKSPRVGLSITWGSASPLIELPCTCHICGGRWNASILLHAPHAWQNLVQVTQASVGIMAWAENCMAFAERMLKDMVEALLEHDAAVARADLPSLHAACLSALRQHSRQLAAGQPAASSPEVVSVKRLEQVRKELAGKQDAEAVSRMTLENVQKENSALQQVPGHHIPLMVLDVMSRLQASCIDVSLCVAVRPCVDSEMRA